MSEGAWECNRCGSEEFTGAVSEYDFQDEGMMCGAVEALSSIGFWTPSWTLQRKRLRIQIPKPFRINNFLGCGGRI